MPPPSTDPAPASTPDKPLWYDKALSDQEAEIHRLRAALAEKEREIQNMGAEWIRVDELRQLYLTKYDEQYARADAAEAALKKAEEEAKGLRETLIGTEQGCEFLHARVEEAKDERDAATARVEELEKALRFLERFLEIDDIGDEHVVYGLVVKYEQLEEAVGVVERGTTVREAITKAALEAPAHEQGEKEEEKPPWGTQDGPCPRCKHTERHYWPVEEAVCDGCGGRCGHDLP